jgi:hypothetical protein
MRQQEPAALGVIADSGWNASHESNGRRFKSILKEQREIKSSPAPFARLIPRGSQTFALVNQDFVEKVCVDKKLVSTRTRNQSDVRMRQNSTQFAQGGHGHHGIADPVGDANDDALDLL